MGTILMLIATLIFVAAVAGQSGGAQIGSGPVGLVLPLSGAPLFAQQVEVRRRSLPDGTTGPETRSVSQVYRDSAGRVRIEWRVPTGDGRQPAAVDLIDPVARSVAMLLVDAKIASYLAAPNSGSEPFQVGFAAVGEWQPAARWPAKNEALGTRVIEGIEVEGARTVRTSSDRPPLLAKEEAWWSRSLGLKLVVEAEGPNWKHTARLENLVRREPDPALFAIPAGYSIQNP